MPFTFQERPDSGAMTYSPPSYTRIYKAVGEVDEGQVMDYALSGSPGSVFTPAGQLYRQDIRLDPDGWAQYVVTVPYGPRRRTTGSFSFSFDTTGATVNIKAAKQHIESYAAPGEQVRDHHGSIGVSLGGDVEGADIIIPTLKLTYTGRHPEGVVDEPFARALANATGHTNAAAFRGFEAGELLFLGATGSDGSQAEAEVAYHLLASSNASGLTVGQIQNIVKEGHHLLWIEFDDAGDSGDRVVRPKVVHIERVYDSIDFFSVFGWD